MLDKARTVSFLVSLVTGGDWCLNWKEYAMFHSSTFLGSSVMNVDFWGKHVGRRLKHKRRRTFAKRRNCISSKIQLMLGAVRRALQMFRSVSFFSFCPSDPNKGRKRAARSSSARVKTALNIVSIVCRGKIRPVRVWEFTPSKYIRGMYECTRARFSLYEIVRGRQRISGGMFTAQRVYRERTRWTLKIARRLLVAAFEYPARAFIASALKKVY